MCWRSSSEYHLYGRTGARAKRSLFDWLRDLWRVRRPQVEDAEVVSFPTEAATINHEADRGSSKAA